MDPKFILAQAIGASSTWGLKHIMHRPAANFPGKMGLYADPQLIAHLRSRLTRGSIVVVGTNGKTTVTNLLADTLEAAGYGVACNRTGANLDSGVATALMQAEHADWGVLESDELWLAKVLPQLQPTYVVLLNLFRDQLDRVWEIERIQDSIANALAASPRTTLIYNADDPLCQAIADRAPNAHVAFGIAEDLGLSQNTVADTSMCQRCDSMLAYTWRQYGQLGNYRCPSCGFHREAPTCIAQDVRIGERFSEFTVAGMRESGRIRSALPGAYTVYNLLAVCTAAQACGIPLETVRQAAQAFSPENGRLQAYDIDGHRILLNLAKNPTGFNQNLRIVMQDPGPKAVAFFINDREADGHDVSWLWDVDFQELADAEDIVVFAGGLRRNDMQVRLKYAGIDAPMVDDAIDFLARAQATQPQATCYAIANYTALPDVKAQLDGMRHVPHPVQGTQGRQAPTVAASARLSHEKLVIAHLYPELLNLYGDGGNVTILAQRARWRGMQVEVREIAHGEHLDLDEADIVFIGGGPDRQQLLASRALLEHASELRRFVEDDGVVLAICGGFQIIGREWVLGENAVPGLALVDAVTGRAEGGSGNRLVGNVVLKSPLASLPVVGYENHAGRTFIGNGASPFGKVVNGHGKGNNDADGIDGIRFRNVVGTYLHGPVLSKNPEVADHLIATALERRARKEGRDAPALPPLVDSAEAAANDFFRTHRSHSLA